VKQILSFSASAVLYLVGLCAAPSAYSAEWAAQLDWSQRVNLSAGVSGAVRQVFVQPGQHIKEGTLLVGMDPTAYRAALAEARADVERLTEEEADARREWDRVKELYARMVSSTTELDTARLRHARARALLAAAQARSEQARYRLSEAEIRAPFDALVLERKAEPGLISASQCQPLVLLVVARADEMLAAVELNAIQAATLALGQTATVRVADEQAKATLRALQALAQGRYRAEWVLPRKGGWIAGMAASVILP